MTEKPNLRVIGIEEGKGMLAKSIENIVNKILIEMYQVLKKRRPFM
jgi:hypothetical protein